MGEARNRGTYEERKAAAIKRNEEMKRKIEAQYIFNEKMSSNINIRHYWSTVA